MAGVIVADGRGYTQRDRDTFVFTHQTSTFL